METVNAFVQCRMSSSRLPGKVLEEVDGTPIVELMFNRIRKSKRLNKIVILTSRDSSDDGLVEFCQNNSISCFRGDLNDVLDRFYHASEEFPSEHIVRLTGDCPLMDPEVIDSVIDKHFLDGNDYTSNVEPPSFPDGIDVEVFKSNALKDAWSSADLPFEREHVTPYIRNKTGFKKGNFKNSKDISSLRLTVDYKEDLELVRSIVSGIGKEANLNQIVEYVEENSEKLNIKNDFARNEGMIKSMIEAVPKKKEQLAKRYKNSIEMYNDTSKFVPLASQTFSKSITQLPLGAAPLFMKKADGAKTWDVDGNEYLDFVNSLACITLGYNYPTVKDSVKEQLEEGTIYSLPDSLEGDVAKLLVEMVPSAEMVRFGKNGTDATSAAVRLSRAYTEREMVLTCGYHGWQDWYIGITTKNDGVPGSVSDLTRKFAYNDIDSLKKVINENKGKFACLIMEPMNVDYPKEGFLESVREICTQEGIVLVFDEMVTGFRYSNGGAQELFNVTPDLSCFGKGIANGYPVSAIVGKKDIMMKMEDIFFSGTFGGELLSLAAAKATLTELKSKPIIKSIEKNGTSLIEGLSNLISEYDLEDYFEVKGHPTWSFFIIKNSEKYDMWNLKTFYLQEMLLNGIYTIGSHNMSYAHTEDVIEKLLQAYKGFFNLVKEIINNDGNFKELLCCEPLKPLFTVR